MAWAILAQLAQAHIAFAIGHSITLLLDVSRPRTRTSARCTKAIVIEKWKLNGRPGDCDEPNPDNTVP